MVGLVLAVSAVLIGVVLILHFWKSIPIDRLTCDPISIVDAPLYTGFLSQIGIFFWSATAAICLFGAKVLSRHPESLKIRGFLVVSGLLTLVLGLDDAFLLHEEFFPSIGVSQKMVFVIYAGILIFYLIRFSSVILETEYVLLGMALFFCGISIVVDWLQSRGIDLHLLEDGAKLVGIVSWLAYFYRVAASAVHRFAAVP